MDPKTVFIVAVTTSRMIFPGLPPMVTRGEAPKMPAIPAVRSITMEVCSDAKATATSKATVSLPAGLKVESPGALVVEPDGFVQQPEKPASAKFAVKTYWGSSETVAEGQPRTTMSDEAAPSAAPVSMPTASYAYWPPDGAKPLEAEASTVGEYALTTDYAGHTSITLDKTQDFLPTIRLTNVHAKADLEKPIKITWKPVANALAYLVSVTGGNANETISWTSSSDPDAALGLENRPVPKEELDKLIEKGVLMPPNAAACTIPAGAFRGSSSVMVTATAFGGDKIETKDGIETRVTVRSIVSIPIAGTNYQPARELPPEEDDEAPSPTPSK